mmetsp:Transcript_13745/g.35588  ORF Transcript_13745/g.35588 Transcript_13745/m.35588 type:complete len:911 (+) Transcript_13745:68-2800(+)
MFQTILYLLSLAGAIAWCYSQPVPVQRLAASFGCIAVTWFYIIRFMVNDTSDNSFDGAYADVIWGGREGNWGFTQALLTWAIVAMVWSHESCIAYQIFGVFGAMSASFLTYRPQVAPSRSVPTMYAVCALVGFWCTWKLPGTQTLADMSWWLWGVHAALLVPKVIPSFGHSVDVCSLYVLLAVLCLGTHMLTASSPFPNTDCKISITVDLFVCSMLTIAHVWHASESLLSAAIAGIVALTCSPGFVLAICGALQQGLHRRATTWLQQTVATQRGAGEWRNLGLWKDVDRSSSGGFDKACAALAKAVGKATLQKGDRVLCAACGRGAELRLLQEAFGLTSVVGLDADEEAARSFRNDEEVRLVLGLIEDMASVRQTGFRHGDFNKILAVDSIYHCDKAGFLRDCAKLLPEGGAVALTDVVIADSAPLWVRLALQAMNIPWANHWTKAEYEKRLVAQGFELGTWESLEPHVLVHWLPAALCRHLDYVLISATLKKPPHRPTVAIVGSGMSGCLTARMLSATHEVTVFEAGPFVNLAGRALQIEDHTVDIPLRMFAASYYANMAKVIEEMKVATTPTRFDACFFEKAHTFFVTSTNLVDNCLGRLMYVPALIRITIAVFFFPPDETTTWGDFAKKNGFRETPVYQICILPQLSWMLSCDLAMVEGYPATVITGFLKAINPVMSFSRGINRLSPCNKAFQDALIKGINIKVDTPVNEVGEDRTVCGKKYDAVVIATEAGAVSKVLKGKPWAPIFDEFKYHYSNIILHRDPALMPARQEEWRMLNVGLSEKEPSSMLSVWMNAYYGEIGGDPLGPFKTNIFQTWNPHMKPKEDSIIKQFHFTRVVHTAESPRLLRRIAELQGTDGIYFAGAYAVHGMGLLEQAATSALMAVELVQKEWEVEVRRRAAAGGADARL